MRSKWHFFRRQAPENVKYLTLRVQAIYCNPSEEWCRWLIWFHSSNRNWRAERREKDLLKSWGQGAAHQRWVENTKESVSNTFYSGLCRVLLTSCRLRWNSRVPARWARGFRVVRETTANVWDGGERDHMRGFLFTQEANSQSLVANWGSFLCCLPVTFLNVPWGKV